MAREYIRGAGGVLTPIGDTQGVLVPVPGRYCKCYQSAAQPLAAGNTVVGNLVVSSGENWITDGNRFVAPVDGIYAINLKVLLGTESVGTNFYVGLFNSPAGYMGEAYAINSGNSIAFKVLACSAVCRLSKDDPVYGIVNLPNARETVGGANVPPVLTVSLVEQVVPDIIANKGALVSGGAFQFDQDGHGYTENYSTSEVRVGTWVDGKPVYKKTIAWDVSNATSIETRLPLGVEGLGSVIELKAFMIGHNGINTRTASWVGINTSTGALSGDVINVHVASGELYFRASEYSGWGSYTLYATVCYTKATD